MRSLEAHESLPRERAARAATLMLYPLLNGPLSEQGLFYPSRRTYVLTTYVLTPTVDLFPMLYIPLSDASSPNAFELALNHSSVGHFPSKKFIPHV